MMSHHVFQAEASAAADMESVKQEEEEGESEDHGVQDVWTEHDWGGADGSHSWIKNEEEDLVDVKCEDED